jgi:hypothetical protein
MVADARLTVEKLVPNRWVKQWGVIDQHNTVLFSADTNAEAWAWIDRNDTKHADSVDRHNRIRNSFAGR